MNYAKDTMGISEGELASMTSDLDEAHHETLPKMHAAAAEWNELNAQIRGGLDKAGASVASRRKFLLGTGAVMGAAVLAACSKTSSSATASGPSATTASGSGSSGLTGDLAVAALAASLENLAVATYAAGLKAAGTGALGAVPPAVGTFVTTAQSQHKDHAAAWNAILTGAGQKAVTGVDMTVNTGVIQPAFAAVKTIPQLAMLALQLEEVAAATYLNGIQNALTMTGSIQVAGSIQPVEMQHVAILNFVLGTYPVPVSFATTTGARPLTDTIG